MQTTIKKSLRKIPILFLAFLMLITSVTPAFAALSSGSSYSTVRSNTGLSYTIGNYVDAAGETHNGWGTMSMYTLKGTSEPVYCIQPYRSSAASGNKAENLTASSYYKYHLSATAKTGINLVSLYGYPNTKSSYSSTADRQNYYVATQLLYWEYVIGKRTNTSNPNFVSNSKLNASLTKEQKDAYYVIMKKMQSHSTIPSFASTSQNVAANKLTYNKSTKKFEITYTDQKGVLSNFNAKISNSNIKMSKSGNTIKLTSSKPITSAATLTLTKNGTETNTAMVLNPGSSNQVMFYGTQASPIRGYKRVNSDAYGAIKIVKTNGKTNKPMANISFTVTNSSLGYSKTVKTNDKGIAEFPNLIPGYTYTVKETVPKDYKPSNDISGNSANCSVKIVSGKTTTINYKNTQDAPGKIRITKTDANDSHKKLVGAEYTIYKTYSGGKLSNPVETIVTNDNGLATSSDLRPGTYYIKETKAPAGYLLDSTVYPARVTSGVTLSFTFDDETKGIINIIKVDSETNEALKGAVFTVYSDENCKNAIETIVTDYTGMAQTSQLEIATYYIKETKAPAGYELDSTVRKVELKSDNVDVIIRPSAVDVTVGNPNEYLEVPYSLGNPEDFDFDTMIKSEEDDIWTIAKIADSEDCIKYVKDEGAVYIQYKNTTLINYVDEECAAANNKDAYIWYLLDGDKYTIFTLDKNNIPFNVEDFEIFAPVYIQEIIKSFTENRTDIEYNTSGSIRVKVSHKSGNTEVGLPGVQVGLYVDGKTDPIAIANTANSKVGTNGICTFKNLVPGVKYFVKEIDTPEQVTYLTARGIKIADTIVALTPTEESPTLAAHIYNDYSKESIAVTSMAFETFEDKAIEVTLHKTDFTTGAVVPGAVITIYNEDGTEYATNTTDDNGDINLYAIPEGKYTFVETVAPDGYTLNTSIFEFEVKLDENGKAVITGDTEITDEPTKVIITKTDAYTQKGVPGAVYTFYNVDGAEVGTITTGEDGTGMIEKLPIGTYTYKETVAPKGYALDSTVYEFTIEADGTINGTTTIEDDPTTVTFTKVNDEGDALEGATFVVYTVEGEEYGTFTTDSTGTFTINYIPVGEYLISEIKAPVGHALNPETYSFTVNPDGSITGITVIENMMIRVSIQKVDAETEKGLAGAIIEIYDKDGNIVNDITETDADGYISVSKLPAGTYTFKEVKAPEGYEINEEIYTFTINEDGSIEGDLIIKDNKIVVPDEPTPKKTPEETPKSTLEKVNTGSAIVAISALAFASGIVLISLRKKIK